MTSPSGALPLAGKGIVITRPSAQAAALAGLIRARGGRTILFPAIEILELDDRAQLDAVIDRLETFDLAIFISANAVTQGMKAIRSRRALPPELAVAGIGRATSRALRREGVVKVLEPRTRFDSEGLLDLPELKAVTGKRIVIFRGVGGRELLRSTLAERGASVDYAECYRRVKARPDVRPLLEAWDHGEIDAVVVTSSEALRNLCEILGDAGRGRLARTRLFVPHPRIASSANDLGLVNVIVTGPGDEGIASSLVERLSASP